MEERKAQPNIPRVAVLLVGGMFLLLGLGCGAIYLLSLLLTSEAMELQGKVSLASGAAIALLFGVALTYQAIQALRGCPSSRFRPPAARLLILVFLLSVAGGQLILYLSPNPGLTALVFPPFHLIASTIPAFAILAFVGRRMTAHRSTWRIVTLETSHGAIVSTFLALCIEIAAMAIIVTLVLVLFWLTTSNAEVRLEEFVRQLQDPTWISDPTNSARLLLSPPVIIIAAIVFVIITPLLEELLKSLGVPVLRSRLQHQSDAFLWGVACGAGFSLVEGLFNGGAALEGWFLVMLLRCGSTLMHCLASGIMGLGWYRVFSERRYSPLLLSYLAAVGLHALWNIASLAFAGSSLLALVSADNSSGLMVASLGSLFFLALLVVLTIAMVPALVGLAQKATS